MGFSWNHLSVLIADDDEELRQILASILQMEGATVFTASNGKDAFDILTQNPVNIVISDVQMPVWGGVKLLEEIKQKDPKGPAVFLTTGFANVSEEEVKKKGALALIQKPYSMDTMMTILSAALKEHPSFKNNFK